MKVSEGRYVLCGTSGGMPEPGFGMSILMNAVNSVTFVTTSLGTIDPEAGTKLGEIFELAAAGKLVPVIDKTFPLADAALSHELMESGNVFGKIVLTV